MTRSTRRPLAYRFIAIALAATAVVFGSLAVSLNAGVHEASAQVAGRHLELAPANSSKWSAALDPSWVLSEAAPGDLTTGSLQIRSIEPPEGATLRFFATEERDSDLLASLRVIELSLGGVNLLDAWDACIGGGVLMLADVVDCEPPPLPVPAGGAGELFKMTIAFDAQAKNALQGLRSGPVTFVFVLDVPDGTETPTPGEGTPTPTPSGTATTEPTATATPTPIDEVDGVETPGAGTPTVVTRTPTVDAVAGTRVPSAPSAGSGGFAGANDAAMAVFATIAITAWIAGIVLFAASRRRNDEG